MCYRSLWCLASDLQCAFSKLLLLVRELHSRRLQRKKVNLSFLDREIFLTCSPKQITWAFKQLMSFFYKLSRCPYQNDSSFEGSLLSVLSLGGSFHVPLCVSIPIPIFLCSFLHTRHMDIYIWIFTWIFKSSHILHPFENVELQFIKTAKTEIMLHSKCNSISTTWHW